MAILNFKEILELMDKVADRGLGAVEIESSGFKVRVEGRSAAPVMTTLVGDTPAARSAFAIDDAPTTIAAQPPAAKAAEEFDEAGLHIITSPIVGTFYRSPNPESAPFVNVGDRVSKGQVLCIVEAMKLMNEIESDIEGVIAKAYTQNGQPIEYGEKLFAVRTS